MSGTLILVVGPSGAGKDTLLDGARAKLAGDDRFFFVKRDITRPASAGGEDHHAVSRSEFEANLDCETYALHWGAHDLQYGIPKSQLSVMERGGVAIANGSRSVLDEARSRFERLGIVSIDADEELLRQRLSARGRESAEDISARIARSNAFQVSGPDVFELHNDGTVEAGVQALIRVFNKIYEG